MALGEKYYSSLLNESFEEVKREWPAFLNVAARMYKYPFQDQIMIYAQRPEATACASMELWNNKINRWVSPGAKGIALIDTDSRSGVRYVFDVADTYDLSGQNKSLQLWAMDQERHEKAVVNALAATYDNAGDDLTGVIDGVSRKLVDEYFDGKFDEIKKSIPYVTEWEFRKITAASVAHSIRARCGLDTVFPDDLPMKELTADSVRALGEATSICSERVLRSIERTIINERERERQNEREQERQKADIARENSIDLPSGERRGLSDTEPGIPGEQAAERVRASEDGIPEKQQTDSIQRTVIHGEIEQPLPSDRRAGGQTDRPGNRADGKEEPAAGQGYRPDRMGASYEHAARFGAGRSNQRVSPQLSLFDTAPVKTTSGSLPSRAATLIDPGFPTDTKDKTPEITAPAVSVVPAPLSVVESADDLVNILESDEAEEIEDVFEFENSEPIEIQLGWQYIFGGRVHAVTDISDHNVKVLDLDTLRQPDGYPLYCDMPLSVVRMHTPLHMQTAAEPVNAETPAVANDNIPQHAEQITAPKLHTAADMEATSTEPARTPAENFRIADMSLGEGGAKTKFSWNIEAIRALKQIEAENRHAAPEEQAVLSRYVGWGGLPQAFDDRNAQWSGEYAELKKLLDAQEYESARASTLNAHYTSPIVIKTMYEAIERMGFTSGNILEPACGVGNFFGMLPESMKESRLYGVELDGISGRIARQLYPNANIQITGFEHADIPGNMMDVAIGNVPFGGYRVGDDLIHDYFFKETINKVRPGGLIAFITSQGTMDKQSSNVRRHIAERAKFLGAVRLPNNAFAKNAGTDVTTDIIFLQVRNEPIDISQVETEILERREFNWLTSGYLGNNIRVNNYYSYHPEMILGVMVYGNKLYGRPGGTSCEPIDGAILSEQLTTALNRIEGRIAEPLLDTETAGSLDKSIPADPNVRNNSYTIRNGTVYFRENSRMYPVETGGRQLERMAGMVALRDCTREVLNYQLDGRSDGDVRAKQAELNLLYDSFTARHGLINSRINKIAFKEDDGYYLLCALEVLGKDNNLERKSDIFTKRTVNAREVITSVDTANDALMVSLAYKAHVDLAYMSSLTGFAEEKIVADLEGVIFRGVDPAVSPEKWRWLPADEYLSGDVREKLRVAREFADNEPEQTAAVSSNIAALTELQPKDVEAGEIVVRLGATWIDAKYVDKFVKELLQATNRDKPIVSYSELSNKWDVASPLAANKVLAFSTYGTARAGAFHIIEETLNMRDVSVHNVIELAGGNKRSELDYEETVKARQKQKEIKQIFKDWIFSEPMRRKDLLEVYNKKFNSIRPREYDGSHLKFPGMNPEIAFMPHQLNAIARGLYSKNNTLLAHAVGAGKTYEMVAIAMESKRLGLCSKPLMAVPKSTVEQAGASFLKLYPSANILVAGDSDFRPENRKKICAKISTGDYDCVIISHEQLGKIPMSPDSQQRHIREEINNLERSISELKNNKDKNRYSIKEAEGIKKRLKTRLQEMFKEGKKDNVIYFEQLGIGKLIVDEAHEFKNLYFPTKLKNVTGLSPRVVEQSSDMYLKCRYMDEITGGKGIVFATGTPVSNSLSELFTLKRYLLYSWLKEQGLSDFDSWLSVSGETVSQIEMRPQGTYGDVTRLARFYNLPAVVTAFKEAADIVTDDMLPYLDRPDMELHIIKAEPSELQLDAIRDLGDRATAIKKRKVTPDEDNMLKLSSDARKIGLDMRLMNNNLPDHPGSKVNLCTENVFRIWEENKKDRLTQLVFCDFSTPHAKGFNVYDDIKAKLIAMGVPKSEIAFIHDAGTRVQKEELFERVRQGDVRILFGSTSTAGTGVNVQDKLIAIHDLDCPWRPSDLEQRRGRIYRQGNNNERAHVYRYVTEKTADAWLWDQVGKKLTFINQIMTSKTPLSGVYENIDRTALEYDEIKAIASGNPMVQRKIELDRQVAELTTLRVAHNNKIYSMEYQIAEEYPKRIKNAEALIVGYKEDQARLAANTIPNKDGFSPLVIGGVSHTEKALAGQALIDSYGKIAGSSFVKTGSYRGFELSLSYDFTCNDITAMLKGTLQYKTALGNDVHGNIARLNNLLNDITDSVKTAERNLEKIHKEFESAKEEKAKPFEYADELEKAEKELEELNAELNVDNIKVESVETENDESMETELETDYQSEDELEYMPPFGRIDLDDFDMDEDFNVDESRDMDESGVAAEEMDSYAAEDLQSPSAATRDTFVSDKIIEDNKSGTIGLKEIFRSDPQRFIIAAIPRHSYQSGDPRPGDSGMGFE